ncbi:MAG: DNA polymerase III subunit gamma/tau [Chlamydiia bacterium]
MIRSISADTYQVIARKYRPQTFLDVIGQEPVVTTLKNAIRFQRTAHAYLFCGCRGTGKTTLARVFSKALNCQYLTEEYEPCNQCSSCLEIGQGRSLDVMEIDGASHRGIDDIRQINETIAYAPSSGKFKIYIIDEVHMLTKEAFNALLKTLEEPPSHVKFFFATTEPHKVLPTIISRCQRFDLGRIPTPLIEKKLGKITMDLGVIVETDALQLVAQLSEGSLRDAESMLDQVLCYNEGTLTLDKLSTSLGLITVSTFFELDGAVEKQDLACAFILAEKIFASGKDLSYFLDSLLEHFRTILSIHIGHTIIQSPIQHTKYLHAARQIYPQELCLYILDYLIGWMQQMSKTTFKRISIEMILLHIIRSKKRVPIETLVYSLQQMQMSLTSWKPIGDIEPANASPSLLALPEIIIPSPSIPKITQDERVEPAPIQTAPTLLKGRIPSPSEIYIQPSLALPAVETIMIKNETPPEQPSHNTSQSVTSSYKPQSKHETVIRFAAVELDGVFSKN